MKLGLASAESRRPDITSKLRPTEKKKLINEMNEAKKIFARFEITDVNREHKNGSLSKIQSYIG